MVRVVVRQHDLNPSFQDRQKLYEIVGRRVTEARKAAKLTQEELALSVSLTRTSITNIEKGRQKLLLHTLFDLAHAMQVPVSQLMPNLEPAENQIGQKINGDLSRAEREWIISELSKPAKKKK